MDDKDAEIARLRAELESARKQTSVALSTAPKSAKPGKSSPLVWGAVGLVALLILGGIMSQPPSSPSSSSSPSGQAVVIDPAKFQPIGAANTTAPAVDTWTYSDTKDELRDTTAHLACTTSTNEARLEAPYRPVTADLCIRKAARTGTNIFFRLNGDGQILCNSIIENCTVKVRFGSGQVQTFSASEASDHSSNIIFINSESRFIAGLKKADTAKIELEYYQAGTQSMSFDTKGLKWPPAG